MNMFLKEKRKKEKFKNSKKRNAIVNVALSENKNEFEVEKSFYKICDRLYNNIYYIERSNLILN